jgi:hypothetical protein
MLEDTSHKNASYRIYMNEKHYTSLFMRDLHGMKKLAMMTIHKIAGAKLIQQGTGYLIYIDVSTSARLTTSLRITRVKNIEKSAALQVMEKNPHQMPSNPTSRMLIKA